MYASMVYCGMVSDCVDLAEVGVFGGFPRVYMEGCWSGEKAQVLVAGA